MLRYLIPRRAIVEDRSTFLPGPMPRSSAGAVACVALLPRRQYSSGLIDGLNAATMLHRRRNQGQMTLTSKKK
jgi:hypothetical protein